MKGRIGYLMVVFCWLLGCEPAEQKASYQLVQVRDGDTILVKDKAGNQQWVELAWLDAPEPEQPFGREAKQMLDDELKSKPFSLLRHDEAVEVFVDDHSVNLLLVEQGRAWVRTDIEAPLVLAAYKEAEESARQRFAGLWGLGHGLMVPPWQWRAQAKEPSRMRPVSRQHRPISVPPKINKRPVNPAYEQNKNESETETP